MQVSSSKQFLWAIIFKYIEQEFNPRIWVICGFSPPQKELYLLKIPKYKSIFAFYQKSKTKGSFHQIHARNANICW